MAMFLDRESLSSCFCEGCRMKSSHLRGQTGSTVKRFVHV